MKIETLKIGEATLTAYIQKNAPEIKNADRRPAVLILPGGGYEFVSNPENEPVALEYSAKGFQAFTLEYSVKEKGVFPSPKRRCCGRRRSSAPVRKNGLSIKKKSPSVGFSAGGHLAASVGVHWSRESLLRAGGRISRRGEAQRPGAYLSLYHGGKILLSGDQSGTRARASRSGDGAFERTSLRGAAYAARVSLPYLGGYVRARDEYAALCFGFGGTQYHV